MDTKQRTIQGCRVQLEFPAQTPAEVYAHLSTILTELALEQAAKGGDAHEAGEMPLPGLDQEAG